MTFSEYCVFLVCLGWFLLFLLGDVTWFCAVDEPKVKRIRRLLFENGDRFMVLHPQSAGAPWTRRGALACAWCTFLRDEGTWGG